MNADRLLETFLDLVRIDSPSKREAAVAAYCERALSEAGFSVRFDGSAAATGSDTGNLVAVLPGTAGGRIALSAHMDCVEPCCGVVPVVEDGRVRSAGDTVLGADDKAGIAAIIEAVRSIVEAGEARPEIVVVLSTCEEESLLGSAAFDDPALDADTPCYVLDAGGAPGTVILGSPRHYGFTATFSGTAAHAGVAPEDGVSAIRMAADAICAMSLGRLDERTTANVGIVEGGSVVNVVPDRCVVRGECRSIDKTRSEEVRASIERACRDAARRAGGGVELSWSLDYEAIDYAPDDPIVRAVVRAARACGLEPAMTNTGGGADANAHAVRGVPAITLGIGMTNYHALDEFIAVRDLEDSARLAEQLLRQAALPL